MIDIRPIDDNDIVAVINLMNDIHGDQETPGYSHNEAAWVSNTMVLYYKAKESDSAIIFGCFDTNNNELLGFISGDTFVSYYDNRVIADLKDCVVKPGKLRGLYFKNLFDAFLDHYASVGVPDWRFDSIKKSEDDRDNLESFIATRYKDTNDINIFVSVRGVQMEASDHE